MHALVDADPPAAADDDDLPALTPAYNLCRRPGADSFAAARDLVEELAADRALAFVVDRALHGSSTPRFYRGRFTGATLHRYETRLALAALRHRSPRQPAT